MSIAATKGKISRLPHQLRQQLHMKMRDGIPAVAILKWLNAQPEVEIAFHRAGYGGRRKAQPAISDANLSDYRRTHYQEWLRDQERVDRIRSLAEFSMQLADAAGGDVGKPAVAIAAGRIMERLESATDEDLFKMSGALAALTTAETGATRARTDRERLAVQRRNADLAESKFQRETVQLFVQWWEDQQVKTIMASKDEKTVKYDRLISRMFGTRPTQEAV